MKLIVPIVVLIVVLLTAACVPIEGDEISIASLVEGEQHEVINIAGWGVIHVSDGSWNKHLAVDGDFETWWSADDFAPQWLEVELTDSYLVERVEVSVSQVRPGPGTHEITLRDAAGSIVVKQEFKTHMSSDGDNLVMEVDPPRQVGAVEISAKQHEGWVAYREVQIFAQRPFFDISGDLWIEGLIQPVYLTHAGDGSGRIFVLEREGRIRIVKDGVLLQSPFLDISESVSTYYHQGLLGLAFPQGYEEHGRFYITYISEDGRNIISRFAVSREADRADPDSEEVILSFAQPGGTHTAGTIAFGPRDGYLYIAAGDGTEAGKGVAAQDTEALSGKILRIDVGSHAGPYTVPTDNPFVGTPGYAPEIWALGLRNPWGMAFDRQSGSLFIPDSGQDTQEEVNFQQAGSRGGFNYGWPHWEGDICKEACELDNLKQPVATFNSHGREFGCAVVGGAVYAGVFLYADFCTGKVWALHKGEQSGWKAELGAQLGVPVSSIGADEAGSVFAVGYATGSIFRLIEANANR